MRPGTGVTVTTTATSVWGTSTSTLKFSLPSFVVRALVSIVTRESERLNAIIDDFLTYSRDRDCQSARVDLCRLLSDTLTLLENRSSGVSIERRYNRHPEAFIQGDGDKLKQVFWNLCSNALRAMPSGGTLTVSLDQIGDPGVPGEPAVGSPG